MRWLGCAAGVDRGILLASCRFIPTADGAGDRPTPARRTAPARSIPTRWSPRSGRRRSFPISRRRRDRLLDVRDLAAKSPDEAGAKFGYRAEVRRHAVDSDGAGSRATIVAADTEVARRDHRRRRERSGQDRRDRADRPRHARHRDPRRARFRLVQRIHQPDRFRPLRQGVQHLCQSRHAREAAARRPRRPQGDACIGAYPLDAAGRNAAGDAGRDHASDPSHDRRRAPPPSTRRRPAPRRRVEGLFGHGRRQARRFRGAARRRQRARRRERRRQIDAGENDRRRRAADRRAHPARRRAGALSRTPPTRWRTASAWCSRS